MRMWEIREGYDPRYGEDYESGYGMRDHSAKKAYEMGYEEGCEEGYEKAMRKMGGFGMRDDDDDEDMWGERRGGRGSYSRGSYGGGSYGGRRRRDSRGRYM